jgi:hypothetical protein
MRLFFCGLLICSVFHTAHAAQMRFLTGNQLPRASTLQPYHFQIVVANASGAVKFTSPDLPSGFVLVQDTGEIHGRLSFPILTTISFTVIADDGINTPISRIFTLSVDAKDPASNPPLFVTLNTSSLPTGILNQNYPATTLSASEGTGLYRFAVHGLPRGLGLDSTNTILGRPVQCGTFRVIVTVVDVARSNARDTQVMNLIILPPSNFQFTNPTLTSGELGTYYLASLQTVGAKSSVKFSASNLPPGLALDINSGVISGTPATPGAYLVKVSAQSGETITATQLIHIAPSSTSNFVWANVVVPPALLQTSYESTDTPVQLAPLSLATTTGSGLPPGLAYATSLTGTPTRVGVFSARFVAVSGADTIIYDAELPVVPSSGGSSNDPTLSLFINSMSVANSQTPGKASWKATCRFNDDRTSTNRFNPLMNPLDDFVATISTHNLVIPAANFKKSGNSFTFKSASGVVPVVSVTIDISAEKITLSMTKDTFAAPLGGQTVPVTFALGSTQYVLSAALDSKGTLSVTPGYRSVSFVGTTGLADLFGNGRDVFDFDALLADPNFHFSPGAGPFPLVIKLFIGGNLMSVVNVDKGSFTTSEQNGKIFYKIMSASALKKTKFFMYDSKTGKLSMTLSQVTLPLVEVEEQLGIEIIIDGQDYLTQMTMFRWNSHTFKHAIP